MAALSLVSCKDGISPSKNQIIKKYSVEAFDKISCNGNANIIFTQSQVTKVEAQGADNIIPHLIVSFKDSTLQVSMQKGMKFRNRKGSHPTLIVSSPHLKNIQLNGAGNIALKETIKENDLVVYSNGAGNFRAEDLNVDNIYVRLEGVGNIYLKGKTHTANYKMHGIGNLNAKDMAASEVKVEQNGIGNISCRASGNISISTNGIGNVDYYGNPQGITKIKKSGIGSIHKK